MSYLDKDGTNLDTSPDGERKGEEDEDIGEEGDHSGAATALLQS